MTERLKHIHTHRKTHQLFFLIIVQYYTVYTFKLRFYFDNFYVYTLFHAFNINIITIYFYYLNKIYIK